MLSNNNNRSEHLKRLKYVNAAGFLVCFIVFTKKALMHTAASCRQREEKQVITPAPGAADCLKEEKL